MRFENLINSVDSHTEGMATRVITGGIPNIPGKTMVEKRNFVKTVKQRKRQIRKEERQFNVREGNKKKVEATITSGEVNNGRIRRHGFHV